MMHQQPSPRPGDEELLDLVGDLVNGTASATQQNRLQELLAADPKARRTYRSYVNLHVALRYRCAAGSPGEDPAETAVDELPILDDLPEPRRASTGKRWLAAIAVAAAMLIGVAIVRFDLWEIARPGTTESPQAVVATVTKVAGARWEQIAKSSGIGTELQAGAVRLVEGYAELTFHSGARMVLDAPVTIELVDALTARLELGRVVATVPARARGFAIETPRARVVDFGTEFGVGVREGGDTEVQVFQGMVVTKWTGPKGKVVDQRLEAGQAVRIDRKSESAPQGIPYYPEGFVRTFPTDRDPEEPGGPLYNRSRFDTVHVVPAPKHVASDNKRIVLDGDLSDWDRSGAFYSACLPPYHENYYLEGMMMYDEKFVYLGAHVGDPAPMRSNMDPRTNPEQCAWRGGSVIVRLAANPDQGWPLAASGPAEGDRTGDFQTGRRPQDTSDKIAHLVMWYHRPTGKARLLLSYGMDFHGERLDPAGWQGAFRMDPNGRGYTLEYAIPWSLLNAAERPPRAGDLCAANWTVHWSDEQGMLSRGTLVEITNFNAQPFRFLRGATWGKAIFHDRGNLQPGTVIPHESGSTRP